MAVLWWIRQDLRLEENPALSQITEKDDVIPLFVLPEGLGAASRWWLHHSLKSLSEKAKIVLRRGDPLEVIPQVIADAKNVQAVVFNRAAGGNEIDGTLTELLRHQGVEVRRANGCFLHNPEDIRTGSGTAYSVFTPFSRRLFAALGEAEAAPARQRCRFGTGGLKSEDLDDWKLLPTSPNWANRWEDIWQPGEDGAKKCLRKFIRHGLHGYAEGRDRPDLEYTSRLSPHLRFGEISPHAVWRAVAGEAPAADVVKFRSELAWREFAAHLLAAFPAMAEKNWKKAFDAYPWRDGSRGKGHDDLLRWQRGMTGYPLVDAGMRELWATGFMHNRVRMVAASFLIKHLRLDWRLGERWFWDTLVDADAANNPCGWQWVAGSGADAAPYFRIFNPVEQGRRYDPDGAYVRRWCPELAKLPSRYIHAPWQAPPPELAAAGVRLGETYPRPMVDHATARAEALEGLKKLKSGRVDE